MWNGGKYTRKSRQNQATGCVINYNKSVSVAMEIKRDNEATRIRHQNERRRNGYVILKSKKCKNLWQNMREVSEMEEFWKRNCIHGTDRLSDIGKKASIIFEKRNRKKLYFNRLILHDLKRLHGTFWVCDPGLPVHFFIFQFSFFLHFIIWFHCYMSSDVCNVSLCVRTLWIIKKKILCNSYSSEDRSIQGQQVTTCSSLCAIAFSPPCRIHIRVLTSD